MADLVFDLPELQYPARLNCANAFLDDMLAKGFADKVAVRSATAQWTYAELTQKVNQIAGLDARHELGAGQSCIATWR